MITKEYIKELLGRYFDAETTLEEEALIRNYFSEHEIDPELNPYADMFNAFSKERGEYLLECGVNGMERNHVAEEERGYSNRQTRRRRMYYIISIAGTAAVLMLGMFALIKDRSNPVLIINGEKIYNAELAIAMAGESLDNMNMAMEKIQNNRTQLEKIGKIGEIISSLDEFNRVLSQNE